MMVSRYLRSITKHNTDNGSVVGYIREDKRETIYHVPSHRMDYIKDKFIHPELLYVTLEPGTQLDMAVFESFSLMKQYNLPVVIAFT
jgi:hypothetical protein